MTLDEIWKQYETYSKGASDCARQIAFAGIAVVWLFKVEDKGAVHLDALPLAAGACFVVTLAADLLQYLAGTFVYLVLGKSREKRKAAVKRDEEYSDSVLWPIDLFFYSKFVAVVFGYAELLRFFWIKLV